MGYRTRVRVKEEWTEVVGEKKVGDGEKAGRWGAVMRQGWTSTISHLVYVYLMDAILQLPRSGFHLGRRSAENRAAAEKAG